MLEVLAANSPMVLFWNPRYWEFRKEAQPYIDDFRKIGILLDTPEGAAARVVEVYDDPFTWWQGDALQEARRRFVERYALGHQNWLECWARVLKEETASSD